MGRSLECAIGIRRHFYRLFSLIYALLRQFCASMSQFVSKPAPPTDHAHEWLATSVIRACCFKLCEGYALLSAFHIMQEVSFGGETGPLKPPKKKTML